MSKTPTEELEALVAADSLHLLPVEALVVDVQTLAAELLELRREGGR